MEYWEDEGKIIYEWKVPEDYPNFTGFDDLAKRYRVIEHPNAFCGVIVEGKFRNEWSNVYNKQPLIRHLVKELEKIKALPGR